MKAIVNTQQNKNQNDMIIEKLEISNYRGFQGQYEPLMFNNQINVFIGINGSGKSSLLDLIAIFLNQFAVKLAGATSREIEYSLNQMDINVHERKTENRIYVRAPWEFEDQSLRVALSWEIIRDFKNSKSNYKELNEYIEKCQDQILKKANSSVPIFKYYQSQRITNEKHKHSSSKRHLSGQLKAYDDAFDKRMEFDEFIKWFIEEENIENREKIARKDFNYFNPNLTAIRNAIANFFSGFKADKYDAFRVEDRTIMTKQSEKSSLVINKNDIPFNLKQLSDGEKIMLLMIADIAHRLAIANPNSKKVLNGKGIVLIDEIDLHLHPAWQREIIPCLLNTFPSIQFFVTSHSPQVLGSINKDNVFRIKDFKISKLKAYTKGRDSNSILYDVFGISEREEVYKQDILDLYNYIEKNDEKNAKNQLDKLTKLWGSEDREIVRANMYYEDLID